MGKAEILEAISGMSVLELSELITEMEEKFGVSRTSRRVEETIHANHRKRR